MLLRPPRSGGAYKDQMCMYDDICASGVNYMYPSEYATIENVMTDFIENVLVIRE